MRSLPIRLFLSLLVALALLASACGSSSSSETTISDAAASSDEAADEADNSNSDDDSGSDSSDSAEDAAPAPSGSGEAPDFLDDPNLPASFEELEFDSPIGDLLGFDFSDQDAMQAEMADMQRRAEEVVATCMRDQGFEYQPRVMDQGMFSGPFGSPDGLAYYSEGWIAKYGFGVSTQRFAQSQVGADLVGFDDSAMPEFDEGFEDPNSEYLTSLSEGEREAYQLAMNGEPPDFDAMDTAQSQDEFIFEPGGCQGEAFEQVFNGGGFAFFEAFGDQLDALEERAESDPRVVTYRQEVASCVSAGGFTWTGEQDPWEYFSPKLAGIGSGPGPGSGDPFEAAGLDPEEMSDREMEEFFAELNRLSPEDKGKLAEVQAEEIALAKLVTGCGGGDLYEQYFLGTVRLEYELEFMAENAAEIEEFQSS